ncbi:TPR-like protein [Backusella circina FSU 941]|nr:TPR-like protein [Backusella circina FSU 941]
MAATAPPQPATAAQKLAQVNEQTWLTMGNLAEMMTDYEKAMNCYESALRHNPYSVVALSQIASLCRGREQFGRAVEYFKRILAIQENNGETWAALGHCYLMMDNLQEAYQAYQQALYHLSNPKDPKLWYGIGILYDRYGSLEHAEEAFSAVMKMDAKFEKANEIYFRLGIIYKQQQKYDLSLQCFRYILHNPPRPLTESDIWFQTGHVYEQQKEYELAKEAYERVLAENPDHAKVLQQLGWLYHQQNTSFCNQALAIQYLTRSLKSDSNDAQSWYLLGRCYMAEQNYNKAYEAYQQAVYRDARNPTFWCSIGVLYYQINQYRDALDAYSRAIRLNPYISEVWYDLGTLYESCNNQIQDALDAYQRAAELDPSNPHIKQRLELLRKSQTAQTSQIAGSAPVPQDVNNPSQYQSGPNGQPLNGASYSQSAPAGPPSSMSAYHTAVGGSQRPNDERVSTPQLPVVNHPMSHHEGNNGPIRDLPMPGPPPSGRRSPGPYPYPPSSSSTNNPREDVRIPDIGRMNAERMNSNNSERMNPIMHDERAHLSQQQQQQQQQPQNLPPMSMRQQQVEKRSPNPSPRPRVPFEQPQHRLSPRSAHSDSYRYEQRSPAQRPAEVEATRSSSSRPDLYHSSPHQQHYPPPPQQPHPYRHTPPVKHEELSSSYHPAARSPMERPEEYNKKGDSNNKPAEDYDSSAADALLSMGNPQLGQKRSMPPESEENKKPKHYTQVEEEKEREADQKMEEREKTPVIEQQQQKEEVKVEEVAMEKKAEEEEAVVEEKEEEARQEQKHEEERQEEEIKENPTTTHSSSSSSSRDEEMKEAPEPLAPGPLAPAATEQQQTKEEEEEEEGEVKEEDEEAPPTAAVAATVAAATAAASIPQEEEPKKDETPVDTAGSA